MRRAASLSLSLIFSSHSLLLFPWVGSPQGHRWPPSWQIQCSLFSVFISLARSATVFLFSFSCSFWVFSRAPWSVSWFGPESFPVFPLYTLPWWSQRKPSFAWGQVQMTCRSRSPAHISLLFPNLFQHPVSPPHILSFVTSACFWFSS